MKKTIRLILFLFVSVFCFEVTIAQQTQTVTGIVTDDKKTPLSGVTIDVKGQSRSVITDEQGKFSIIVDNPSKAALICSYVGYKTVKIIASSQNSLVISLQPGDEKNLLLQQPLIDKCKRTG
jgi:hypothetical protein